jgi:hypothetical protein
MLNLRNDCLPSRVVGPLPQQLSASLVVSLVCVCNEAGGDASPCADVCADRTDCTC